MNLGIAPKETVPIGDVFFVHSNPIPYQPIEPASLVPSKGSAVGLVSPRKPKEALQGIERSFYTFVDLPCCFPRARAEVW